MTIRAKVFTYEAALDAGGVVHAGDRPPLVVDDAWTPEHLLLAATARCVLKSLRHSARGASVTGSARMASTITKRDQDGLYAQVDAEVHLDVTIEPAPEASQLQGLLARAERGCFIGNSLEAKPRYRWRVNDVEVSARA